MAVPQVWQRSFLAGEPWHCQGVFGFAGADGNVSVWCLQLRGVWPHCRLACSMLLRKRMSLRGMGSGVAVVRVYWMLHAVCCVLHAAWGWQLGSNGASVFLGSQDGSVVAYYLHDGAPKPK